MKRQSSCSSSRSRHHQKSIGCMSAISKLLFQRHNGSKFLTSGKKQQQEKEVPAAQQQELIPKLVESPRHRQAQVAVARLMGLDSFPVESPPKSVSTATLAFVDRRRKLVGALEKCDEDLQVLQNIIQVVKTSVSLGVGVGVAVDVQQRGTQQLQPEKTKKKKMKKKPGEGDVPVSGGCICLLDRLKKEAEADAVEYGRCRSNDDDGEHVLWRRKDIGSMVQCVEQVCQDIAWGERREIGIIGMALQYHIYRDLIDETVREMQSTSKPSYFLTFQACRRGLAF